MSSIAEPFYQPQWRYSGHKHVLRAVLLIALALHALLLLIPSRKPLPLPAPRSVAVDISFQQPVPAAPEPVVIEPDPIHTAPTPEIAPNIEQPSPAIVLPTETTPPTVIPDPSPPVTTAYLLEQARDLDWQEQEKPFRIPGVAYIPDLPANLSRPVLPISPNTFDDYVLSGEQEILDQWMEPNGVINAVVKLPNGQILCGSAKPWDPMNPLVEHVAMYRACGGGGKRTTLGSPFLARD